MLIFQLLLNAGSLLYFVTGGCIHAPDAEKTKEQLRKSIFQDYLSGDWSYKVIDEYRKKTNPNRPSNLIDIEPKQIRIFGEPSCRKSRNITSSDTRATSTCPWYVVLDVDFYRQPQYISKAKCSCNRCFSVDRRGRRKDMCTEVKSFIPVIKWRCPAKYEGSGPNYFRYFADFETVPVGCTCTRPIEV